MVNSTGKVPEMIPLVSKYYGKDSEGKLTLSEEARAIILARCEKVKCKECGESVELTSDDEIACTKNPSKHITGWNFTKNLEQPPSFNRVFTKSKEVKE
jgi:hypothetical protein